VSSFPESPKKVRAAVDRISLILVELLFEKVWAWADGGLGLGIGAFHLLIDIILINIILIK
jgi:hypothetical protein